MQKIIHDVKPGILNFCQICNSKNLKLIINLGKQPLADTLSNTKTDPKKIKKYPLKLVRCCSCSGSQLSYIVPGSEVYHKKYPYRTGITKTLKDYQKKLSTKLYSKYKLNKKSFVIDIGSNDGTLLEGFKKKTKILGIEPTNTAKIANKNGIKTLQSFINEGLAKKIIKQYGQADLITATNVFAHMADLGTVIRSIEILLKNNGHFILENHYLLDIIKDLQFDTIYHEHIRNYSLKSLLHLFSYYKLKIVHAEKASRYGGNIRVHIAKDLNEKTNIKVRKLLSIEKKIGLYNNFFYKKFNKDVLKSKKMLKKFIAKVKKKKLSIVAKGCPARASTLLNYYNINVKHIPYIAEQSTSLKLNKYMPGLNIPIVNSKILLKEQPDYVLILAWHLWKPIVEKWKKKKLKSKFIIPLPKFKIV